MASKPSSLPSTSADRPEPSRDPSTMRSQETSPTDKDVLWVIESLKKQVVTDRCVSIQKRIAENKQKLVGVTNRLCKLSIERTTCSTTDVNSSLDLLTKRQKDAIYMHSGVNTGNGGRECYSSQEDNHASTAVLLGSNVAVRNAVRPIKLTEVKRLPPYTTWIFLDRNQRMTEDQSVVGRRRIYYDQSGGETLICSDSEEEAVEEEEEKINFVESEDYILCMTIKEVGLSELVLESLAQCFSRNPFDVKARHEFLSNEGKAVGVFKEADIEESSHNGSYFLDKDKDLDAALDSFDNLFCRRCLVFDCRLHGCSQDLVLPADKQPPWTPPDEKNIPCGPNCYRSVLMSERFAKVSTSHGDVQEKCSDGGARVRISSGKKSSGPSTRRFVKCRQSGSASSNAKNISDSSDSENAPEQETTSASHSSLLKTKYVEKGRIGKRNRKQVAERVLVRMQKRQKKIVASNSDSDSIGSGGLCSSDKSNSSKENEHTSSLLKGVKSLTIGWSTRKDMLKPNNLNTMEGEAVDCLSNEMLTDQPGQSSEDNFRKGEVVDENVYKQEFTDNKSWEAIEKGLLEKGVEIFGRKSCLIARNLLNGLKTCWEVFQYMNCDGGKWSCPTDDATNLLLEGYPKGNNEVRRRSRFLRRRGRVRRLKYTWKSAAYHSFRKRITERKDQPCRQYNPCGCQITCGKQCSCLQNGTCCEKYCGCPKSCKNRFRGCHCAKSQCRSRQCPCFAADRECDPDICRNCWVGCGDGTLGIPGQRGDNYECRNMKLLLKQQRRVLIGKSDVSGWGAFLQNSVSKHEYLGEYTGELVSHREADKRGKIYDRENSSFLFNLNDQFVLDAYRKGDKLKFANHSPDPNCYAKVIMVAGDHRVGIFAKERISAGEELFYDYRYEPDRAPAWALKPEASGTKKEDGAPSSGRAKKLA
ncbi:Histone-lysine N-methyltransferase [Quillaja saponaria]|uniref:Histone-lysine N-methyltransferase n=1 Tax=Quillaja saponaria TaxID=32244 RepID=A0AAD7L742_QUISA|nr:Histone-lysine N-methyltransferase [Quillaja saponaria]